MADIETSFSICCRRATITFSSSLASQTQFETLIAPSLSEEDTEIEGKNIRIERRRGKKKRREMLPFQ